MLSAVAGVGGVAGPHCKLVRSPYPISEECFPVPECEHRCDVVSWYRTCYFRLLPRVAMSGERARVRHQAAEEVRRGEGEGVPGGPGEL